MRAVNIAIPNDKTGTLYFFAWQAPMDEPAAAENLKKFKRRVPKTPVLPISAAFGEGMEKFRATIRAAVGESPVTANAKSGAEDQD